MATTTTDKNIATTGATYGVIVRWVDTGTVRRAAKRCSVDERTVTRDAREDAWRFVCACVRKAQTSDHIALVDIMVTRDTKVVWTWKSTAC